MNKFEVIQPSMLLAPYVKQYWFLKMESTVPIWQRLVPLGCLALSLYRGQRPFSLAENDYLPQSHLFGIATNYIDIRLAGQIDFICIILQPAAAKAIFSMSLCQLGNGYVSLEALNDSELCELEQQLTDTTDNLACTNLIEQFLIQRIYKLDRYEDQRLNTVVQAMYNGENQVSRLAETACLSYKQFNRVFTENMGVNPKYFLQIIRFQKLHHLLQNHSNMKLEQMAEVCGYYDKSHLIKDLKSFSGFTPTQLQEVCDPEYSNYHALFRLAFIDLPCN